MIKFENEEYSRLLIRFSKENDIYAELNGIINLTKKGTHNYYDGKLPVASIYNLLGIFDKYITWDETSEGFDFWYIIHLKWYVYLKQHASQKYDLKKFEDRSRKVSLTDIFNEYKKEFQKLCHQQR